MSDSLGSSLIGGSMCSFRLEKLAMKSKIALALWATVVSLPCIAAEPDDSKTLDPGYQHASPEAYERWRDLKYGLRIHWGIYSQYGFEASWPVLKMPRREKQEYFQIPTRRFNPTQFDAEEWMRLFERCGLKCFAVHHEASRRLFDVGHQDPGQRRVNWAAAGGPQIEPCDLAYSIMETPLAARHRQGIARRGPPARDRDRPLLLAHRLVRRRFPHGPLESAPRQGLHAAERPRGLSPASPGGTASRSARSWATTARSTCSASTWPCPISAGRRSRRRCSWPGGSSRTS